MIKLTAEQRTTFEMRVKKTRDVNERNRLCVILARDNGHTPEAIAEILCLSRTSVYDYLAEYDDAGKTQHASKGGSVSKLSMEQTKELVLHLIQNTYKSTQQICEHILSKYNVAYKVRGLNSWLKNHNFVYKPPIKIPGKLDPEKQKQFIQEYQLLKAGLKAGEVIHYIDAVHPQHQTQCVCGWIQKGETKTIQTTGMQKRLHFLGALNLAEMSVFTREYATVGADEIIDFLRRLESESKASKIYIISDNARSNKNKALTDYLKGSKIEFRYLPPYSPNLNAIERLWKVLRERTTYNKYYEKFADFSSEIRRFFTHKIFEIKDVLVSRINDNFQTIALNPICLSL